MKVILVLIVGLFSLTSFAQTSRTTATKNPGQNGLTAGIVYANLTDAKTTSESSGLKTVSLHHQLVT